MEIKSIAGLVISGLLIFSMGYSVTAMAVDDDAVVQSNGSNDNNAQSDDGQNNNNAANDDANNNDNDETSLDSATGDDDY